MENVTIKHVSKESGYSLSTVSRVLSGSEYPVSEKAKAEIIETAERLGYVSNMLARSLKTCRSQEIAVIIPSITNPFYTSIITGVNSRLSESGYNWSKYELPHSCVKQYDTIRIEENDGLLMFYKADTGELIHKCRKSAEEGGDIPYKDDAIDMETVGENAMRRVFDDVEDVESFIAMLREQNGRYANSQMNKIVSLAKVYTVDQVESAILYCIRVKKCSLNEVQAYLLYRYGLGMAKRKMTENTFYHCKKRAEEIAEEQNGRLD